MKKNSINIAALLIGVVILSFFFLKKKESSIKNQDKNDKTIKTSGAGQAMDMWSFERAYPYDKIPVSKYAAAFEQKRIAELQRSFVEGEWESLGPKNIGGRTLCLAFHPTNEDLIFAGSASGGLWKTTTQGVGEDAWEYVPTGFPVLGVASIAIDKNDPDIMFIGTGETYGVGIAEPGTVNRLTRGTYGIGILKTIDGGGNWTQVLQFDMDEIKGVQDIAISNQNSQELYAASTDGLFQSLDGGSTWQLVFNEINCIDVEIDPSNGDIIYVTQGNFNTALDPNLNGIFKSVDKGVSFNELVDPGLITAWSGNAKLTIDPSDKNILYASIQVGWFNNGATTPAGIYKSTDAGSTWNNINNQNIAFWQGWYSHDIAVNPANSSEIINVGINTWKSTNSGVTFSQKSSNTWTMGEVAVDVPEGGTNYVHSDIHAVYYHPINNKIFFATDGGVFVSDNGELPYTTLNGGLQTLQLYADMGSSASSPNFIIAGAQDNASYIYKGNPSWWRVIGGDGMSAAVNQEDDQIVYGSWQGLNIMQSINNGTSFGINVSPTLVSGDFRAFSAPYELAPSNQSILYAGATYLYKSFDGGSNWNATSGAAIDNNPIMNIAISPFNPDIVFISTSPDPTNGPTGAKILKSTNSGLNFQQLSNGLPNRICKDLEFDPTDENVLYAVFSGFGTDHVFKTIDGGTSWNAIDNGLPDVPTNTILIDPLNPDDIYVGNDLGVYYSENGGITWEGFSDELPEAVMIYDLNESPSNRHIRIATHGHGIYQRSFVNDILSVDDELLTDSEISVYPNPTSEKIFINIANNDSAISTILLFNIVGQKVMDIDKNSREVSLAGLSNGIYFLKLSSKGRTITKKILKQ